MEYVITGQEPADALRYFEEISAIPRGSGNEAGIAAYLKNFAEERGLFVQVDELYNVLIKKPGSKGCENLSPVLLQGHSDIVCEKNQGTVHDFEKDPIRLKIRDGHILYADGTTLGADDGFALSYMLSILDRQDIVHPPLECLITTQEEVGMVGALSLKPGLFEAKRLISMDVSGEGQFLVASAGGNYVEVTVPTAYEPVEGTGLSIQVRGLLGGHSGLLISEERGNSNKILGRILYRLGQVCPYRLASLWGGAKANAIPREADAVVLVGPADLEAAKAAIRELEKDIQRELAFSDKGFRVELEMVPVTRALGREQGALVAKLLHLLPTGMQSMSKAIPGLVNSSLNLGVVTCGEDEVRIETSVRSAEDSLVTYVSDWVYDIATSLGAKAWKERQYPAFSFEPQSQMRQLCMSVYEELFGKPAKILAGHGGTECGIFTRLQPGLDVVGFGPDKGASHTPDEWMDLDSYARYYTMLLTVLERLAK